jgi:hypothetical protein
MAQETPQFDAKPLASTTQRSAAARALAPVGYLIPRRYGARLMHPLELQRLG